MTGQGAEQRAGRGGTSQPKPHPLEHRADSPQRTGGEQQRAQRRLEPLPLNPSHTMLTVEELNRMDDISGSTLYSAEARRLPRIPRQAQQPLIAAARQGNTEARDALILTCLNWTMTRAARIYWNQEPEHLDLMDLVSVANVELVEKFDRALATDDPISYLLSCAAFEMQSYCSNKNPLIQRPRQSHERRQKVDPVPATTVSLEKPLYAESTQSFSDILQAKALQTEADEAIERKQEAHYAFLYEAINQLSPSRRRAFVQSYGCFGEPAKTRQEIAASVHLTESGIRDALYRAKKDLAEKLTPYFAEKRRRR